MKVWIIMRLEGDHPDHWGEPDAVVTSQQAAQEAVAGDETGRLFVRGPFVIDEAIE